MRYPGDTPATLHVRYGVDTVRYVLYQLYHSCISPRSSYSEIQYILYLLYLGPDTVDTACISPAGPDTVGPKETNRHHMSPIVTNFGCASATQTLMYRFMLSPPLAHLHFYGSRGRACSKLLVHVGSRIAVRALGNVLLTSYESLVVSKFSTTNNFSTRPLCSSPQFTGARAVRCESKRVFSSRSARVRRPPTQRSTCLRPSARRRPPPTPAFNSRIYERLHTCSRALHTCSRAQCAAC